MSKTPISKAKSAAKKKPTALKPLPIAADATIYGTHAKISALADYLEVCALKKVRVRKQQLADIIADNGWQLRELMVNPADVVDIEDLEDDLPAVLDLAEDAADRVFSTIRERAEILGARYPFKIDGERVVVKSGFRVRESPYVAMLAILVAHSFKLSGDPAPTEVLEDVVGDVLKNKLRLGINFGRVRRRKSPFLAALAEALPLVKLNIHCAGRDYIQPSTR